MITEVMTSLSLQLNIICFINFIILSRTFHLFHVVMSVLISHPKSTTKLFRADDIQQSPLSLYSIELSFWKLLPTLQLTDLIQ